MNHLMKTLDDMVAMVNDTDNLLTHAYPTTFNKNTPLETKPHYTNSWFQDEDQTVFGKAVKGLNYDYSDRIEQWDYTKSKAATTIANDSDTAARSCRWYEVYLSAYYDKKITIKHIVAGVNRSSGYPYCVFGY